MSSLESLESEQGLSLLLHSSGQSPTDFTNVLKTPIKLGPGDWEVGLANLHIPAYQQTLEKNDYARSSISYNMGMFTYNHSNGEWELIKNSNRELWKMTPDRTFDGLDANNIDSHLEREHYIKSFMESLKLGSHTETSKKCLELYLNTLAMGNKTRKKDLFNPPPRDSETLSFKNLPKDMTPTAVYDFFEKLADIKSIDMLTYIKQAAIAYGQNSEEHIRKIFRNIFLKILSVKVKDGSEPVVVLDGEEEGIANYKRYSYLRRDNAFKLEDLYYSENYRDLFASLWKSHKVPPHPVLDKHIYVPPIMAIYATFGDRMAKFLSVSPDTKIVLGHCLYPRVNMFDANKSLIPRFGRVEVDSYFIYSDLVKQSVRVGNTITNLLAVVSVSKKYSNMMSPMHLFKPLSHTYFHSVAVKIRDQNGDPISFEDNSYSVLEILIRRRDK